MQGYRNRYKFRVECYISYSGYSLSTRKHHPCLLKVLYQVSWNDFLVFNDPSITLGSWYYRYVMTEGIDDVHERRVITSHESSTDIGLRYKAMLSQKFSLSYKVTSEVRLQIPYRSVVCHAPHLAQHATECRSVARLADRIESLGN